MDKTNSSLVLIQLINCCFFYLGLDIETNSWLVLIQVWISKQIRDMQKTNSWLVLFNQLIVFFYLGLDIEKNSRFGYRKKFVICEKQIHGLISKEIDDMDKTSSLLLVI
ncbi:unnamed protein product [Rotaria magnacalcarata]